MNPSIELLERKISRLERAVRALLVTLGASAAALLLAAAAKPTIVRASAFQLVSESGDVVAELAVREGRPGLHLKDENGVDRISLFHDADTSGLFVADSEGVTRIGVAQFAHGGGGVALHGPGAKGAAVLYLKGTGSLRFFDADGAVTNQMLAVAPGETAQDSETSSGKDGDR